MQSSGPALFPYPYLSSPLCSYRHFPEQRMCTFHTWQPFSFVCHKSTPPSVLWHRALEGLVYVLIPCSVQVSVFYRKNSQKNPKHIKNLLNHVNVMLRNREGNGCFWWCLMFQSAVVWCRTEKKKSAQCGNRLLVSKPADASFCTVMLKHPIKIQNVYFQSNIN